VTVDLIKESRLLFGGHCLTATPKRESLEVAVSRFQKAQNGMGGTILKNCRIWRRMKTAPRIVN